jgi:3-oxoisoapionate decarboxylase
MKVGVGSYAFRWSVGAGDNVSSRVGTAIRLLERSAACGAQVVQICENVPLERLADEELAEVRRRAADLGLVLEVGIKGSEPGHLRRHLEICAQVAARLLRVVLSDDQPAADILAALRSLAEPLQTLDLVLAVENHFRFTPAELVGLIEAVGDSRVGICLDPLNSISQLVGPGEVISTLAPHALSVHAKDAVTVRRGTGFCIVGCPIGEGMVDIRGVVASLKERGRSPNIVVESWMDQAESPEATATREEQWTRQGISYLQGVI